MASPGHPALLWGSIQFLGGFHLLGQKGRPPGLPSVNSNIVKIRSILSQNDAKNTLCF